MPKRKDRYEVTHSYAPDPDPAKVAATLEYWKNALAERMAEEVRGRQQPIARIHLPQPRRKLKRPAAGVKPRGRA